MKRTTIDGITLDAVAGVAGDAAAFALANARGGRRVYVPKDPASDSTFVEIVGLDAARRLARRYGGCTFTPGRLWRLRERIAMLDVEGMSRADIATRIGCTERAVYAQLEQAREGGIPTRRRRGDDEAQLSLLG